jgi:hypothetical protein
VHSVKLDLPEVSVDARAYKLVDDGFQADVMFSNQPAAVEARNRAEVGIVIGCGTAFRIKNDLSVSAHWDRLACSVGVVESTKTARGGHILKEGANTEFDLGNDGRVRVLLDQWADATVLFIRESESLVIRELQDK